MKRPGHPMSMADRAKQFVPFAALKGLPEALAAAEKRAEARAEAGLSRQTEACPARQTDTDLTKREHIDI